jgi:hypothetical protein
MGRLTDLQIRNFLRQNEPLAVADGEGAADARFSNFQPVGPLDFASIDSAVLRKAA